MTDVFLKLLNMSIAASWVVLAVVVFRALFRKAPRWISLVMWGTVALRLVIPFSVESPLSMIPTTESVGTAGAYPSQIVFRTGIEVLNSAAGFASEESNSSGTFASGAYTPLSDGEDALADSPDVPVSDRKSEPSSVSSVGTSDTPDGEKAQSASPSYDGVSPNAKASHFTPLGAASAVWLGGVCTMIAYAAVSCAMLRRRTRTAVLLRDNIRQSERVSAPFTFGIFRPEIFLPFGVGERDAEYMIAHEKAHIARRDNIIKPASFLLLSVYWFNPVIWAAYILMCRDIEFACDERVVRSLGPREKADYSQAMLSCSAPRTYTAACPLAFGSDCVRRRIKRVLGYKKPSARLVVAALTVCVLLSACTLTDPVRSPSDSSGNAADTQSGQSSGTVDPADSEITDPTPEEKWKSLEDIREGYTVGEAKRDGCVVMDGSRLVSGEKYWVNFVNRSADGQDAAVRIYQEYTDQGDEYFVKELRHENGKYIFRFWDWKWETDINSPDYGKKQFLSENEYKYLFRSAYSLGDVSTDIYLLADSTDVTGNGYLSRYLSSTVIPGEDDGIYANCTSALSFQVPDDYHIKSVYGTVFYDIDGDGREEKLCLGMGMTSGIFSFTASVYDGFKCRAEGFFCPASNYVISFGANGNGEPTVRAKSQDGSGEARVLGIGIDGSEVFLTENGERVDWTYSANTVTEAAD